MKEKIFSKGISYIKSHFKLKLQISFLLSGFLPVLLFLLILYPHWYKILQKKEQNYMESKVQEINDQLNQTVTTIERNMVSIFTNSYISNTVSQNLSLVDSYAQIATVESILKSISNYSAEGVSYTLIDSKNQVYTNGSTLNLLESFYGPLCSSVKETASNEIYFTVRYSYTTDNEKTITLARPWYINGILSAVLIVDIPPSLLEEIIQMDSVSQYLVVISNTDYEILYVNDDQYMETLPSHAAELFDENLQQITIDGTSYEKASQSAFLAYCNTSILMPSSLIFQDSIRLHWQMLFILLLVVLQTILFSSFISRTLSKEIITLRDSLKQLLLPHTKFQKPDKHKDEIKEIEYGMLCMEQELKKLIQQNIDNERKKRQLELKVLQQQMNPHMIYNTLNTIIHLAQLQGVRNIEDVALAMSHMLKLLAKTDGDFFTIRQELQFIQNYITLKKYNTFQDYQLILDAEKDLLDQPILKLLLQPFVENSVKYAFQKLTDPAEIFISIHEENSHIHIEIKDNGTGIPAHILSALSANTEPTSAPEEFISTGIRNCAKRLVLQYGNDHSFRLQSDGATYTKIILSYPRR